MRLSLPWSSFEHMAATWISGHGTRNQVQLDELMERYLDLDVMIPFDLQPPVTSSQLRSVLAAGRLEVQRRDNQAGMLEGVRESEGEGVVDLTPISVLG